MHLISGDGSLVVIRWFSRRWDLSGKPDSAEGSPWWTAAKFCLRCVQQQVRARFPVHRLPEWAPAFVTHCPEHFGEPLRQHCLCCHRQEPGWMIVARGRHGAEVHCRYYAVALHHWSRGKPAPLSASLQVTLQLESTLIECLRGQPPDSFWVGPVDAEDFVSLAADLLAMSTRRDSQEALTLADHLAAADWWDDHVLGYQAVTAADAHRVTISAKRHASRSTPDMQSDHARYVRARADRTESLAAAERIRLELSRRSVIPRVEVEKERSPRSPPSSGAGC